jgi:histone deacetylase 6
MAAALAERLGGLSLEAAAEERVLLTIDGSGGAGAGVVLSIRPCKSARAPTSLVYDARMVCHAHPRAEAHVERPERLTAVRDAIFEGGLAAHCLTVPSRLATRAEVELVHEARHWDRIEWVVRQKLEEIEAFVEGHESLYLNSSSMESARYAAGCVIDVVTSVVSGQSRNGMALVRPPGHHAEAHTAMGFCVFNTVAIAAQHARTHLGCKRVLIVDWDVHHGNGIQRIFEHDPNVLYFSIHRSAS